MIIPIYDQDHQGQGSTAFITEFENEEESVSYSLFRNDDVHLVQLHEIKNSDGDIVKTIETNSPGVSEALFNRLIGLYLDEVQMMVVSAGEMIIKTNDPPLPG